MHIVPRPKLQHRNRLTPSAACLRARLSAWIRFGWLIACSLICLLHVPAYAQPSPVEDLTAARAALRLTSEEQQWIAAHPEVNVAVKRGWMPIEFKLENEQYRGISIDYLNQIASLTGLHFHWVEEDLSQQPAQTQVLSSVSAGARLPAGFQRLQTPHLTIPYAIYTKRSRIKHPLRELNPVSLGDLRQSRVAIFKNAALSEQLRQHYPQMRLMVVDIADEAFEYLRTGQVDAYIGNEMVVDYHMDYHRLSFAQKSGLTPYYAEIGMAVASDVPLLASIMQKSILAIGPNQPALVDVWRPEETAHHAVFILLVTVLLMCLLMAMYWMYHLHRKVRLQEKESQQKIWHQANFDYLTQLPNRYMLQSELEHAISRASVNSLQVGLLLMDLDGFKDVNDTAGHAVGDKLLMLVAERLKQCVPHLETTARLGGDEFVVLVPDVEEMHKLSMLAQRILQLLEKPYSIDGTQFYVSASIGIATYPLSSDDAETLLMHADQALFSAKRQGKNQFQFFTTEMLVEVNDRISLTNDLRTALHHNQFSMHYQPIYDLKSGQMMKAEALLRWHHPQRGYIPPDVFIRLAEESGMMLELGKRVLDLVLADLPLIEQKFGHHCMIGINISPSQFWHPEHLLGFVESLRQIAFPCQSICFEITESLFLEPSNIVHETIQYLHHAGIKLSIDDFGTGYSALAYLKHYAIDFVKIDKSFVRNLSQNQYDYILCKSIIQMSHQLNILVVAEGVEYTTQKSILNDLECDYIQGYLVGKPVILSQLFAPQTPHPAALH